MEQDPLFIEDIFAALLYAWLRRHPNANEEQYSDAKRRIRKLLEA